MELRPGYKKTEIGVVPQDWERSSVRMMSFDFKNGFNKASGSLAIGRHRELSGLSAHSRPSFRPSAGRVDGES